MTKNYTLVVHCFRIKTTSELRPLRPRPWLVLIQGFHCTTELKDCSISHKNAVFYRSKIGGLWLWDFVLGICGPSKQVVSQDRFHCTCLRSISDWYKWNMPHALSIFPAAINALNDIACIAYYLFIGVSHTTEASRKYLPQY